MSADNRTVATDALETLGTIITPAEKRDAIHLAVENVIAAHELAPGTTVQLVGTTGQAMMCGQDNGVGIVDPFLRTSVKAGERFWLVVNPREIASLRHVWEHPAFPLSGETDMAPSISRKELSKTWLQELADSIDVPDFDSLMESMHRAGESLHFREDAGGEIPPEAWDHYEAYTGEKAPADRPTGISCAC